MVPVSGGVEEPGGRIEDGQIVAAQQVVVAIGRWWRGGWLAFHQQVDLLCTAMAGRVAAITESEPGIPSERASEHAPGQPESAAAEAMAESHHHEAACPLRFCQQRRWGKAFGGSV